MGRLTPSVRANARGSSAAQRLRRASGRLGESIFDLSAAVYQRRGMLWLTGVHFPVRGAPGAMAPAGKGDFDRCGWVRDFEGVPVPLALDLKRWPATHASYQHDADERHQLVALSQFGAGGLGLLALHDPDDDVLVLTAELAPLLAGAVLPLRSRRGAESGRWRYQATPLTRVVHGATPLDIARGDPPLPFLAALRELAAALHRTPAHPAPAA